MALRHDGVERHSEQRVRSKNEYRVTTGTNMSPRLAAERQRVPRTPVSRGLFAQNQQLATVQTQVCKPNERVRCARMANKAMKIISVPLTGVSPFDQKGVSFAVATLPPQCSSELTAVVADKKAINNVESVATVLALIKLRDQCGAIRREANVPSISSPICAHSRGRALSCRTHCDPSGRNGISDDCGVIPRGTRRYSQSRAENERKPMCVHGSRGRLTP